MVPNTSMASFPQLENSPLEGRLELAKKLLGAISNPADRAIAELLMLTGQFDQNCVKKHIVVLIHGIRTHAVWQERLAESLNLIPNVEAYPIGYGFFDALRFLSPVATRKYPISRVTRELRTLRADNPDADISVVAHSFGTYIISEILNEETDIRFHRIQLCGSIIDIKYRWDKVKSRIKGQVVNDAGTKDIWPVIASVVTWGFGSSGTFGFKTASVRDRYYHCGHSDFFEENHMETYWIPLIVDGEIKPSKWTSSRSSPGFFIAFINIVPLKSLLFLSLGYALYKAFY